MSDDPNVDQPCQLWGLLSGDIHSIIVEFLWRQNDQASVNAVMQTSRELRLLTSALISKIKVTDMLALRHFPCHATLRTLDLALPVGNAAMWLQATWAVVPERLRPVSKIQVNRDWNCGEEAWDEATISHLKALPGIISSTCPNTTSLELISLFGGNGYETYTFLQTLGQYDLPHLVEVRASCVPNETLEVCDWGAIQIATCFPPGLRKLALPGVAIHTIHYELLQYLVNLPSLIELEAFSLCPLRAIGTMGPFPTVQSEACAWQVLRLQQLPDWALINSFTTWPGYRLEVLPPAVENKLWTYPAFEWGLGVPNLQLASAVGEAAAKLAACIDNQLHLLSHQRRDCLFAFDSVAGSAPSDASVAVALVNALSPLDATLRGIRLVKWRVTSEVLQALTVSLPNTVRLSLEDCVMYSGAWQRLMVQPRLESLSFLRMTRITLSKVMLLPKGVRQHMEILIGLGCMTAADKAAMPEAVLSFAAQRRRPAVIIEC